MRQRPQSPQHWAKFENFPAESPMTEIQEFFREMKLNVSNLKITSVTSGGVDRLDAECSLPNQEELDKCLVELNEMQYINNVLKVTDVSALKKGRQFSPKDGRAAGVGWNRGMITKTPMGRETIRPPPLEVYSPPQGQNRYESRFHAPVQRGRNFSGRNVGNRGAMQSSMQQMQQKADAEGFSRVKTGRRNRRERDGRRSREPLRRRLYNTGMRGSDGRRGGDNSRFGGGSDRPQSGGGGRFGALRSPGQGNRRQQNRVRQDRGSNNRNFGMGRQQPEMNESKPMNKPQRRPQNRFAAFIDEERVRDD